MFKKARKFSKKDLNWEGILFGLGGRYNITKQTDVLEDLKITSRYSNDLTGRMGRGLTERPDLYRICTSPPFLDVHCV